MGPMGRSVVAVVATYNGKGQELVNLTANEDGEGAVVVYDPSGRHARNVLLPRR